MKYVLLAIALLGSVTPAFAREFRPRHPVHPNRPEEIIVPVFPVPVFPIIVAPIVVPAAPYTVWTYNNLGAEFFYTSYDLAEAQTLAMQECTAHTPLGYFCYWGRLGQ